MKQAYYLIKTDYLRYVSKDISKDDVDEVTFCNIIKNFLLSNAFRLSVLYRISVPIYKKLSTKRILWLIPSLWVEITRFLTGSEIDPRAEIGEGLRIIHGVGIVIGLFLTIGRNACIYNDITIGYKNIDEEGTGQAKIGDGVRIGTGARLLGNITIGSNVVIGANAVVTKSFPDNVVVVGIPARVLKKNEE